MPRHAHRILLVEDHDASREGMHELLELDGHYVGTAASGREALDVLRDGFAPCLILLDLLMPDVDGAAFRAEQVGDPKIAAVPVVLLSGSGSVEKRAAELGVSGYLLKPIEPAQLYEVIERHCRCA